MNNYTSNMGAKKAPSLTRLVFVRDELVLVNDESIITKN